MMRSAINIILVADEGKYDLRFIEAELDNGISVDIGERTECDGTIRWRIKAEDIVSVNIRRDDPKPYNLTPQKWWCCKADFPNHEPDCENYKGED